MNKTFLCLVRTESGVQRESIEAPSAKEARAMVRARGMIPLEVKTVQATYGKWLTTLQRLFRRVDAPKKTESTAPRPRLSGQRNTKYHFRALTMYGNAIQGDFSALNKREVRAYLREKGLYPLTVERRTIWHDIRFQRTLIRQAPKEGTDSRTTKSVHLKDLTLYTQQLSSMLEAGLPVVQSLHVMQRQLTNPRLAMINQTVHDRVYQGENLAEAYAAFKDLPPIFTQTIAAGELSGNLDQMLHFLGEFFDKQVETQNKIRGAMAYPVTLMVLIFLITLGLMFFIVPSFVKLFEDFHIALPLPTRLLLASSKFLLAKWWTLPILFVGIWATFRWFVSTWIGKYLLDQLEFRIPVLGKLRYYMQIRQFLHELSLYLRSGIPMLTAVEQIRTWTRNQNIAAQLDDVLHGIAQGISPATLFEAAGLFPPFINQLFYSGEESGNLDSLLERGKHYLDQEIDRMLKSMTSLLEPMLTVLVSGMVMFILGSLYLPLIGLMGNGGKLPI